MKLKDWLPEEALSYFGDKFLDYLDEEVKVEYSMCDLFDDEDHVEWKSWIGSHKNVKCWVELSNGYAVGWNENESRGWSFPVAKIKSK